MLASLMSKLHAPIYRHRLAVLVREISASLKPGDKVLDIGCGNGTLGRAIMEANTSVAVEGLERVVRGGEPITVHAYDGRVIPFPDKAFDCTIVADVLHHEPDPMNLLRECARVSRRLVIIKDHRITGRFSKARVSLMDWAANAPYGVPCLYTYNTLDQWRDIHARLNLKLERELTAMDLYPGLWNPLFGKSTQYMAFLRTD